MTTTCLHHRVALVACAIALLLQISPVLAEDDRDDDRRNRPVAITFTKWSEPPPTNPPVPPFLFAGFANDGRVRAFVAEVLWRQASVNGHVNAIEAMYEVVDGPRSFTALIRGGTNAAGAGLLDGVILDGWRTGAPVHVEFQRYPAIAGAVSCEGAPENRTCFLGLIRVGRAPGN